MSKRKIIEVLITALLSALIAFLQSLLTANLFPVDPKDTATVAGVIGGAVRCFRA